MILVVLRPRVDEISAPSLSASPALHELGDVGVVLVGQRPYGPTEVAANLGAEVLGVLADDAKGAAAIDGTGGVEALRGRARWCAAPVSWPQRWRPGSRPAKRPPRPRRR